jgi:hypothetical protein
MTDGERKRAKHDAIEEWYKALPDDAKQSVRAAVRAFCVAFKRRGGRRMGFWTDLEVVASVWVKAETNGGAGR